MNKVDYEVYDTISSLPKYLEIISRIYEEWGIDRSSAQSMHVWFRGQNNDLPMLPSLLRPSNSGKVYDEFFIINTFKSLYKNYTPSSSSTLSELFALMQHSGTPTRLLDWSESALAGLYFAIEDANSNNDPVVWVMSSSELNRITEPTISGPITADSLIMELRFKLAGYYYNGGIDGDFFNIYREDRKHFDDLMRFTNPLAFFPASSGNQRIAIQKGVFTIHGLNNSSIEEIFKNNNREMHLRKLKINKRYLRKIQNDLRILGVTPRQIFPDLYGLSKELRSEYFMR